MDRAVRITLWITIPFLFLGTLAGAVVTWKADSFIDIPGDKACGAFLAKDDGSIFTDDHFDRYYKMIENSDAPDSVRAAAGGADAAWQAWSDKDDMNTRMTATFTAADLYEACHRAY